MVLGWTVNGAAFDGYDHFLSTTEKQTIVRNAIIWAVNYWKSTVNMNGVVIEDMSETSSENANFHFTFTPLTDKAGFTPNATEVQLASNVTWTDNISYASDNRAIDINTIILHEMGHIFLGGGHSTNDGTSLMWDIYPGSFRLITECDKQALLNLYPLFNITVDNNFTDNTGNNTHGKVGISGYPANPTAPITIKKAPGQSVTLTAISPQTDNQNYQMIWHTGTVNPSKWRRNEEPFLPDQSVTFTVSSSDNNATYQAQLRKICNITFQNSFVGISNGGKIQVNGITYDLPTSAFNVVELNPIVASPVDRQTFNNIIYHFSKWSDGNTSFNRTFYPSANATYTAQFIGKPSIANRNLHTGQVYNQPIVLYWNEHPNAYVTKYQIWRQVKHNGVLGSPQLLTTVNRGTLSYVDYDYVLTNGYTADLIFYDVRLFYSLEGTYSDPSWMPVYGDGSVVPKSSDSTQVNKEELDYSISNYPNPFNPVTNIQINMKDAGFVNVSVYDLLGQKVAELVNEEKEAGRYTLLFDGSELPSGTYIYTMRVGNYSESRKMILMK